jgi:thioredoxin-related protein
MKKNFYNKSVYFFKLFITLQFLLSPIFSFSQSNPTNNLKIEWLSFEKAIELNKNYPKKKIFVDVYTDWCGWCKKMDATTFSNIEIIRYIKENFYAVKLNAESKDTIVVDGKPFYNLNPQNTRSTHQLAEILLNNKMSYPSYVFLDELARPIFVVPGYMTAANFEPVLNYVAENMYYKMPWEVFQKQFKGKVQEKE